MTPVQVRGAIRSYMAAGIKKPPSPEATAKEVGCGKKSMLRLFASLRAKEAELGTALNKRTRLTTNVEVDGHNLRTGSLGAEKAKAKHPALVKKWQLKHKNQRMPKYFLMPIKVLGAWQRGTDKNILEPGHLKFVAPGGKPGTESLEEVNDSKIMNKIASKRTVIFPDGAEAWKTAAKQQRRGLKVAAVVHQKSQFVKKDRVGKARGASSWRGTQTIDRRWDSLQRWVGAELATLKDGMVNDALWVRVRSFQWRAYCSDKDKYKLLGNKCK
jgi:hypothetical protein